MKNKETGLITVIGSERAIENSKIVRAGGANVKMFVIMMAVMFSPWIIWIMCGGNYDAMGEGATGGLFPALAILWVYLSLPMLFLDLDATECYFFGYKKSDYYRATKVTTKKLQRNSGLVGEFRSYVLGRKLNIPHKMLYNVCVPMPNGNFQEVDAVLVTENCVYVLECKNRYGNFRGRYDEERWVQHIGSQQNASENIYLQNEKHVMAVSNFLLAKNLLPEGSTKCVNCILTNGKMTMPGENQPENLLYGHKDHMAKQIREIEKNADKCEPGFMQNVYEALLPYALYTEMERTAMMQEREIRTNNRELSVGSWQYGQTYDGAEGIAEPGEEVQYRWNKCYNQVLIRIQYANYWLTSNLVQPGKPFSSNQISQGVDSARVREFKKQSQEEKPLMLKIGCYLYAVITILVAIIDATGSI